MSWNKVVGPIKVGLTETNLLSPKIRGERPVKHYLLQLKDAEEHLRVGLVKPLNG